MTNITAFFWVFCRLLRCVCRPCQRRALPAARKIEILFLGHNSPAPQFGEIRADAQGGAGIRAVPFHLHRGSRGPERCEPGEVRRADRSTRITPKSQPEQEKALLDFVAGGKGFLPLHCASFCFQNSAAYIALVGAQFQKHKTGEFAAEVVKPEHQIMLGIKPFQVWDETYVHTKHNTDRTILMERVDENGREPWTWVRMHGKGRIFYTAYGHDERVWGHPSFHRLVRNAILWTAPSAIRAQLPVSSTQPLAAKVPAPRVEP